MTGSRATCLGLVLFVGGCSGAASGGAARSETIGSRPKPHDAATSSAHDAAPPPPLTAPAPSPRAPRWFVRNGGPPLVTIERPELRRVFVGLDADESIRPETLLVIAAWFEDSLPGLGRYRATNSGLPVWFVPPAFLASQRATWLDFFAAAATPDPARTKPGVIAPFESARARVALALEALEETAAPLALARFLHVTPPADAKRLFFGARFVRSLDERAVRAAITTLGARGRVCLLGPTPSDLVPTNAEERAAASVTSPSTDPASGPAEPAVTRPWLYLLPADRGEWLGVSFPDDPDVAFEGPSDLLDPLVESFRTSSSFDATLARPARVQRVEAARPLLECARPPHARLRPLVVRGNEASVRARFGDRFEIVLVGAPLPVGPVTEPVPVSE